jgi:hypothetical protein
MPSTGRVRFLGAFVKAVQTASFSFIVYVCPFACLFDRIEELGPNGPTFITFYIGYFQRNLLSLKSERNVNALHKDLHIFILISPSL